ncbi:MAG TPA: protein-L-isoaspartate O-methyltransferase [Stellaceae bacterium]|nr:protein-L-isoaspartate O-methyltransferase [Stellaceae bacterium]
MIDYAAARLAMVESQLRTNKVTDEAVLEAFLAVPRERFVPAHLRGTAYVDGDLPLGGGRYMMEPMVLARLIQLAEITRKDNVLEIGCGTGYGTALLARLARSVVGVESEAELARQAGARLRELAVDNAMVVEAPLAAGCPARAPYRVILCQGAVARVPEAVAHQLAEGGRLISVLQEGNGPGRAVVMISAGGVLSHWPSFDATVPPLPGFQAEPSFVF